MGFMDFDASDGAAWADDDFLDGWYGDPNPVAPARDRHADRLAALADGRWIQEGAQLPGTRICRMHSKHVANTLRMLMDKRRVTDWPDSLRQAGIDAMRAELAVRGLSIRQAQATPDTGKYRDANRK